jgi:glutathione S-transferase
MEDKIRLYELVTQNGRSVSPYVWRIRYSLAHKGLPFESVPLGFSAIATQFGGRFKTVPVIEHGATIMAESWDIVEYLDHVFPDRPLLFGSAGERATLRLLENWIGAEILRPMFRIYALDILNAARPEDRPYFRSSRESWLKGVTLEEFTADRASRLPKFREGLLPLRAHLARFPFLGGGTPNYADYMVLGLFQWVGTVSTLPLLAKDDDALRAWLDRGFDLYGGIGRAPGMQPLFE